MGRAPWPKSVGEVQELLRRSVLVALPLRVEEPCPLLLGFQSAGFLCRFLSECVLVLPVARSSQIVAVLLNRFSIIPWGSVLLQLPVGHSQPVQVHVVMNGVQTPSRVLLRYICYPPLSR
jgi:hypothetical protein